jgi:hypothetical protein
MYKAAEKRIQNDKTVWFGLWCLMPLNLQNTNESGIKIFPNSYQGRHGRDHVVVGFMTTYAITAYHH